MSDMADDGEGWGGATPGGGGDMGPNGGSEVVFGVTVHGVVDFAVRYQYYVTTVYLEDPCNCQLFPP